MKTHHLTSNPTKGDEAPMKKNLIESTKYAPVIDMFRFFFKAYYLGNLKTGIAINAGLKAMQKKDNDDKLNDEA